MVMFTSYLSHNESPPLALQVPNYISLSDPYLNPSLPTRIFTLTPYNILTFSQASGFLWLNTLYPVVPSPSDCGTYWPCSTLVVFTTLHVLHK